MRLNKESRSAAMRQQDRLLRDLKRWALRRYPCVRAATLVRLLSGPSDLDASIVLERWEQGHLIGIKGSGGPMFPRFQVDTRKGEIHRVVTQAMQYFDAEEKANGWPVFLWFTTPRPYLDERVPAECLTDDPLEIINALKYEEGVAGG